MVQGFDEAGERVNLCSPPIVAENEEESGEQSDVLGVQEL
jgi:hypothetical protein